MEKETQTESFFDSSAEAEEKDNKPADENEKRREPLRPAEPEHDGWKEKYEALERVRKDEEYLAELRRMDADIDADTDTLGKYEGGDVYRKYREMGLSAKAAYAALTADDGKDDNGGDDTAAEKKHINPQPLRKTSPVPRMDRQTREMVSEIFEDMTSDEREALYRRVTE